jgi:hypothetical protein
MSTAMLNIFVRTVKRRMEKGEDLEEILASYTKLSDEDKEEIRQAVID